MVQKILLLFKKYAFILLGILSIGYMVTTYTKPPQETTTYQTYKQKLIEAHIKNLKDQSDYFYFRTDYSKMTGLETKSLECREDILTYEQDETLCQEKHKPPFHKCIFDKHENWVQRSEQILHKNIGLVKTTKVYRFKDLNLCERMRKITPIEKL
jgi:hypothetical protein